MQLGWAKYVKYQNGFISDLLWFIQDLWPKYIFCHNFWLEQDINMQFFCWTLWVQGYHPDHTDPVNYGYSRNVGNIKNF